MSQLTVYEGHPCALNRHTSGTTVDDGRARARAHAHARTTGDNVVRMKLLPAPPADVIGCPIPGELAAGQATSAVQLVRTARQNRSKILPLKANLSLSSLQMVNTNASTAEVKCSFTHALAACARHRGIRPRFQIYESIYFHDPGNIRGPE